MDGNFYIYTDLSALPVDEHEAYLAEGFGGVCTGGTAVIEVFSVSRQISKNDLVTVLPLQSVLIREVSPDFSMTFFKIDKTMFLDTMSSLGKITPDFFFYMRKNFQVRLTRASVVQLIFGTVLTIPLSGGKPYYTCCVSFIGISTFISARP